MLKVKAEDWWDAFEIRWRRVPYEILTEPRGEWRAKWESLERKHIKFLEPNPPSPWEREKLVTASRRSIYGEPWPPGGGETTKVFKISWPSGGIFVPQGKPESYYEPLNHTEDILSDVQHVRGSDPQDVLHFVNKWGVLGVGIPGAPDFPADAVGLTGERLSQLKGWLEALYAMQRGRKTNVADFAEQLSRELSRIRFAARPTRAGLRPVFQLQSLWETLCLEVWGIATEGKRLRRCPNCEHLFIRGRENQTFCAWACANRYAVRRWKRRQRQKKKRKQKGER